MIGKTIKTIDYTGKEVTRKVLGIDPCPITSGNKRLKGEHFILADENGSYKDRTYSLTSTPYEVIK